MKKFKKGLIFSSLIAVAVFLIAFISVINFEKNPNHNNSINISTQTKISFVKYNQEETLKYTYEILSEDDLTVSIASVDRNDGTSQSYNVVIPSTVSYNDKNYTVVEIGDNAFASKDSLIASVVMPTTIVKVGYIAFLDCSFLSSIDLYSVKSIGEEEFYCCSNLASVYLSN